MNHGKLVPSLQSSQKNTKVDSFIKHSFFRSILGSNFMVGSLIEFDVENQRVGFVESECDYIHATSGKHSTNVLDPYSSREDMNMYLMRSILVDSFSSNHTQLFIMCAILSLIYFIPKSRSRNDCIFKNAQ